MISLSRLGPMLYVCHKRPAGAYRVGRTRRFHFLFSYSFLTFRFQFIAFGFRRVEKHRRHNRHRPCSVDLWPTDAPLTPLGRVYGSLLSWMQLRCGDNGQHLRRSALSTHDRPPTAGRRGATLYQKIGGQPYRITRLKYRRMSEQTN